jgi:hypothetical protein
VYSRQATPLTPGFQSTTGIHICLDYMDRDAVVECSISSGCHIGHHDASILYTKSRYIDCVVGEATEIELCPNNMIQGGWPLFK